LLSQALEKRDEIPFLLRAKLDTEFVAGVAVAGQARVEGEGALAAAEGERPVPIRFTGS